MKRQVLWINAKFKKVLHGRVFRARGRLLSENLLREMLEYSVNFVTTR